MRNVDNRRANDIEKIIEKLSHSYTPEWHYDSENPDIGATIAKLYSYQVQDNIDTLNGIMERYQAEFVNMLDLTLNPAMAARSLVVFNMMDNVSAGTEIAKGTKLIAAADEDNANDITFETERNLFVTSSKLTSAFMVDYEDGSVIPLLGKMDPKEIYEGEFKKKNDEEVDEEVLAREREKASILKKFILFNEKDNSICRSVLVMYHENLFDVTDDPIFIRFSEGDKLTQLIDNGILNFKYIGKNGAESFDSVTRLGDGITYSLVKHNECRKFVFGEREYSAIYLEAVNSLKEDVKLGGIGLSSKGGELPPEFVTDGNIEFNRHSFEPFTDILSIYNECYIGQDRYFSKTGSKVTISFSTKFLEKDLTVSAKQEEERLTLIKRKPRAVWSETYSEAIVNEISFEYYNGLGWKKLNCDIEVGTIFAEGREGEYLFSFVCPDDWRECDVGAYSGRCIRMQLIKSDNCYLRPCIHHYPVITDMKMSYTYEDQFIRPDKLESISGTVKKDITKGLFSEEGFVAIGGSRYNEDAVFLGFDSVMKAGPISIYFEVEDSAGLYPVSCRFEYSSIDGFKPLRVLDYTDDFTKSGIVRFIPPSDMSEYKLEDQKRVWIRVVRNQKQLKEDVIKFMPRISEILLNAIPVINTYTTDPIEYFIDESLPNMHFSLSAGNILDAEVWVNEKNSISKQEIDDFHLNNPDIIRVEYDFVGNVSSVYIKWEETDSFNNASNKRCYMIDRLFGEIVFSDGMECFIPRVTDDVAFTVKARYTNGADGNVDRYKINDFMGHGNFIDSLTNPVKAFGGSGLETIPNALKRGASIIHSRNRLVSISDYKSEILNFSDSIDKVEIVPGQTITGRGTPADISFVILMKDFMNGSFSFHNLAKELKNHLLESCEMTISEDNIHIVEPTFVEIAVNVWVEVANIDDSFEIQAQIRDVLTDYLNPVTYVSHAGWNIGTIPKKSQILMRLSILKNKAIVKRIAIIGKYSDGDGENEVDITDLAVTPFMVCKSGIHNVHIIYD